MLTTEDPMIPPPAQGGMTMVVWLWPPAELEQQAEIVTDRSVSGDPAASRGEDVDLLLAESLSGRRDAQEELVWVPVMVDAAMTVAPSTAVSHSLRRGPLTGY